MRPSRRGPGIQAPDAQHVDRDAERQPGEDRTGDADGTAPAAAAQAAIRRSILRSGISHIAATVAYSPTEMAGTKNAIGIAAR